MVAVRSRTVTEADPPEPGRKRVREAGSVWLTANYTHCLESTYDTDEYDALLERGPKRETDIDWIVKPINWSEETYMTQGNELGMSAIYMSLAAVATLPPADRRPAPPTVAT
ncbi:hypothetical protein Q5752_000937 [Cryptotrichosporon argae]